MTTYTQLARLPQIVPFDPAVRNAWGPPINAAWNAIEQLAAGNGSIDLTGLTSYSVSVANDATDQARQAMLAFIGTIPAPCTVTVPPISRIGWVSNACNANVVLTAGGAVNLTILPGAALLYSVTGNAITAVPISFTGNGQVNGNLVVTGTASIGGNTTIAGTATIAGNTTVNGRVFANLGITALSGISVSGGMSVLGGLQLAGRNLANIDTNNINTLYCTPNVVGLGGTVHNGLHICTSAGGILAQFIDSAGSGAGFNGPVNASAFTTSSDRRVKSKIRDIGPEEAYDWVRCARARTYMMDGYEHAGFIAQEDIDSGRGTAVRVIATDDPAFAVPDRHYAAAGERLTRDYHHDIAYLTKALAMALGRIDALEAARVV